MHMWGEEGFDFDGLDEAGIFISSWLVRWARLAVFQTKEKYGTLRIYCHFGWESFYSLWRPHYHWIPKWYPYKLDLRVSSVILPPINKLLVPLQKKLYRWRYGLAVKKYPHLREEILCCADWQEELNGL